MTAKNISTPMTVLAKHFNIGPNLFTFVISMTEDDILVELVASRLPRSILELRFDCDMVPNV